MRAALQEEVPEATAKVLVTNVPDDQISYDIRVRVARRKFYPINNWQIVKELFQARYIDPQVAEQGWIAERLLDGCRLRAIRRCPAASWMRKRFGACCWSSRWVWRPPDPTSLRC